MRGCLSDCVHRCAEVLTVALCTWSSPHSTRVIMGRGRMRISISIIIITIIIIIIMLTML
jgi:hypothetical protein